MKRPLVIATANWPRNVLIVCLFVEAWLIFLHFRLTQYENPTVTLLGQAFDLTRESALPTYWSSLLALGVGASALAVFLVEKAKGKPSVSKVAWLVAAILFTCISLDDAMAFHERLGAITSLDLMERLHYRSYPWHITVAPLFALGFLAIAIPIWRAVKCLPGLTFMLLVGFACYGGAIALDFVEGIYQMSRAGSTPPAFLNLPMLMVTEEALEMAGTTFFLYVFFSYFLHRLDETEVLIQRDPLSGQVAPRASQ